MLLDPGRAAFILLMRCHTKKMERQSVHCKLIPLQLRIVQTALNSERGLHGLPADHIALRVHFSEGCLAVGRHQVRFGPAAVPFVVQRS